MVALLNGLHQTNILRYSESAGINEEPVKPCVDDLSPTSDDDIKLQLPLRYGDFIVTAFVIFQGEITNPEDYETYKPLAGASVAAHGGTYLVRGGKFVHLEGEAPSSRTVILEFDSIEAASSWYESSDYAIAKPIRQKASEGSLYIIEG
ncbi:MAG TPA: hypothetical protein DCP89_02205 [Acidimicrobiaceae bacterium]|nr:hypothetical protein [Acidimicrobiaceae bacterium]